ncbi:hypothetical protein D3C87_2042340 [compost metagenome]
MLVVSTVPALITISLVAAGNGDEYFIVSRGTLSQINFACSLISPWIVKDACVFGPLLFITNEVSFWALSS